MRVGTSVGDGVFTLWEMDHPHACGDKDNFESWFSDRVGSSPCVWGQGTKLRCLDLPRRDHPHACGDKLCGKF